MDVHEIENDPRLQIPLNVVHDQSASNNSQFSRSTVTDATTDLSPTL